MVQDQDEVVGLKNAEQAHLKYIHQWSLRTFIFLTFPDLRQLDSKATKHCKML